MVWRGILFCALLKYRRSELCIFAACVLMKTFAPDKGRDDCRDCFLTCLRESGLDSGRVHWQNAETGRRFWGESRDFFALFLWVFWDLLWE